MKVILLGGNGRDGPACCRSPGPVARSGSLTLTGRRLEAVQALAEELGGPSRAITLDVNDYDALVSALKGHDVARRARSAPITSTKRSSPKAAIVAGVSYVSICDDHDAAQDVFALDNAVKERGVTILTGAGWTPGLTNILAKKGVSMLDEAKKIHIAWVGALADADGVASLLSCAAYLHRRGSDLSQGRHKTVRAGTGKEIVTFPRAHRTRRRLPHRPS